MDMCDWERRSMYTCSGTCRSYNTVRDGWGEVRSTELQSCMCTMQSSEEEGTAYRRTTTSHYINMVRSSKRKRIGKVFDLISDNTDPNLVTQQLDIGNMINGGGQPEEILKKYPGRFVSMHVKDEILANGGHEKCESTILGAGIIKVQEMVKLGLNKGGTKHLIIEQESYQGKTPMECIKEDLVNMKKWGF